MTHWLWSAIRRVTNRLPRRVPATARGGSSRKIKGVSTVEYALILVAVVAIVGGAAVFLDDQFDVLFTELKAQVTEQKGVAAGLDDKPT